MNINDHFIHTIFKTKIEIPRTIKHVVLANNLDRDLLL